MRKFLILVFLATAATGYSQADKNPEYVSVNWTVGAQKTVYQTDSTIIYQGDSLLMSTGTSSDYQIKIVSRQDTVYEVLFRQINVDPDFSLKSEMINTSSIQEVMEVIVAGLQDKFTDFEYSFLVDKNTGQAFDVKNRQELIRDMEAMVVSILNESLASLKMNLDEQKKTSIQVAVNEWMKEQMIPIMNTMMNSFNYIFQAYSFPYLVGDTYTMDLMVYDINEIKHGSRETEARIRVNSSLKNSKLNIDYEYEYDKESAYRQYIVSKGKEKQIPLDQFEIEERVIANFDLKSSWITDNTSIAKVKMGDIKVHKISHALIK